MVSKAVRRGAAPPLGGIILGCLVLLSCRAWGDRRINDTAAGKTAVDINAPGTLETITLVLETAQGKSVSIRTELARSDEERRRGLMNRQSLPDGEGMLFIFDRDQILNFWMKNTLIPLSIAYISSSGEILEIWDMQPQDLTGVVSSRSVRYALEVPQGYFHRAEIGPGDRLRLPW